MGPDESGSHDLSKTVEQLSPESTMPDAQGAVVMFTREKVEALIGGIHRLAKANLRLYGENKWIKRLLAAGVACGALLCAGLVYLGVEQHHLHAKLDDAARQQADDAKKVRDVDRKLDEIPRLKIRPADTADPTSQPVAVIEVPAPKATGSSGTKSTRPPKPAAIELPLAPPKPKKEKKQ